MFGSNDSLFVIQDLTSGKHLCMQVDAFMLKKPVTRRAAKNMIKELFF